MVAFSARLSRLAEAMLGKRVETLLVTHLPDVRWICGFTGSNAALVVVATGARTSARLFTDGRYSVQARDEVQGATVRIAKKSALAEAVVFAANRPVLRCGFDAATTSVATLEIMRKALRKPEVKTPRSNGFWQPVQGLVSALREVKDTEEIALLRRAAALGCELYEGMLGFIEVGMRELDVAAELEHRARVAGAEGMSFETIVASGARSAMPHARATAAVLEAGTPLTLDFGIMLDGYCSDMTRTVYLRGDAAAGVAKAATSKRKRREEELRRVFEAVLEAQGAAVDAVRAGTLAGRVDEAARGVLRREGLLKFFSHSTGHGLGLEIHEGPRIAAEQKQKLLAGMVVTVEPGVYLPRNDVVGAAGGFGVRIEDTVVVVEDGCEILTPAYKGWVEL